MFHIFGKKKPVLIHDLNVYAPADGEVIPIEETSDSVFANKTMGDGFAVLPTQNTVRSPVAGEVIIISNTKHAIGLRMKNGYEVLIHMGVDTVELNGKPFDLHIHVGDILEGGQLLGTMDLSMVKEHGLATDVIVVFTDNPANEMDFVLKTGFKKAGDIITTLQMKKEHV